MASVVLVAVSNARVKARDAKRFADLKQMQKAVELYYDVNNVYPGIVGQWYDINACDGGFPDFYTIMSSTMATVPKDPGRACNWYYPTNTGRGYIFLLTPENSSYYTQDNSNCYPAGQPSLYYCEGLNY